MSFSDDILNKLFKNDASDGTSGEGTTSPIVSEPIVRKEYYNQSYKLWLTHADHSVLVNRIYGAYQLRLVDDEGDITLHLLDSIGAKGLYFTFEEWMGKKEFQYLFDYFKDKVLELGYHSAASDRRIKAKGDVVETLEIHYLKPPFGGDFTKKRPPNYGSVQIEFVSYNDVPTFIKLIVVYNVNANSEKPLPFSSFMEKIFDQS
jgi:hypothetical protein